MCGWWSRLIRQELLIVTFDSHFCAKPFIDEFKDIVQEQAPNISVTVRIVKYSVLIAILKSATQNWAQLLL